MLTKIWYVPLDSPRLSNTVDKIRTLNGVKGLHSMLYKTGWMLYAITLSFFNMMAYPLCMLRDVRVSFKNHQFVQVFKDTGLGVLRTLQSLCTTILLVVFFIPVVVFGAQWLPHVIKQEIVKQEETNPPSVVDEPIVVQVVTEEEVLTSSGNELNEVHIITPISVNSTIEDDCDFFQAEERDKAAAQCCSIQIASWAMDLQNARPWTY